MVCIERLFAGGGNHSEGAGVVGVGARLELLRSRIARADVEGLRLGSGETANSISDDLKDEHAEIPWSQITATRNRLIHGYFDVDLNVVWRIASEDVPTLVDHLQAII